VAAPSYVFSVASVAKTLDEDEAWLEQLAIRLGQKTAASA
jgi:hypothetical protein